MARKTVMVSDLSGGEIPEGKGAIVTIKFSDTCTSGGGHFTVHSVRLDVLGAR